MSAIRCSLLRAAIDCVGAFARLWHQTASMHMRCSICKVARKWRLEERTRPKELSSRCIPYRQMPH